MKLRWILVLLLTSVAFGQSHRISEVLISGGQPFPTIRVCTEPASGTPCTPLTTIYSDPALTIPLSNPFVGDAAGNYGYYVAVAGFYHEQVSGNNFATYDISYIPLSSASGSGSGPTIQTNGTPNGLQSLLNFSNSSGAGQVNFTNPSGGVEKATVANIQGTDPALLSAGTISGTSILLCTDANGGATTSSCPLGTGTITGSGTVPFIPVWTSTTALGNSSIQDNGSRILHGEPTTFSAATTWSGSSSGQAVIQAAASAGSPNPINLPIATGATGSILTSNGANPQQTSWTPKQGTDSNWLSSGTITGALASLCTDTNGGATTVGCLSFQVNSFPNFSQNVLNFVNGNGCTFTNPSSGIVQVGCAGSGLTVETNSTVNTLQSLLNFTNSTGAGGIAFTNPSGGVEKATVANVQGSDPNLLSSGTISGTGVVLCTDSNGGATTSGCAQQFPQVNDVYLYVPGTYANSQVLFYSVPVRNVTIPSGLTNSHFGCVPGLATPTGSLTVTLEKNGSSIGTIAFTGGSCTPSSVTFSSSVSFNGTTDTFQVLSPASADATFSNFFADIWATRSN